MAETKEEVQAALDALDREVEDLLASSVSRNTQEAYAGHWNRFVAWCNAYGEQALPVQETTVVRYLTDRRDLKIKSLRVVAAAIARAQVDAGYKSFSLRDYPKVGRLLKALQRKRQEEVTKKKAFLLPALRSGLPQGSSERAVRDRALLLVGFFTAMRRSELVNLRWKDLTEQPNGDFSCYIGVSKTDQEAAGQTVILEATGDEFCPVKALCAWRDLRPSEGLGLVFPVSTDTVARIVKAAAKRAGLDESAFGGHSLRSGFVTSAVAAGVTQHDIMGVTRHTSSKMVEEYTHAEDLKKSSPGRTIVAAMKKGYSSSDGKE